ncbi:MAG TPA: class I SAM-dependent methyltransferase [Steroidobacteraceae bacterium]|nr:class I SAM-dependent methyltransferase [Steroidobacteraceae bacterium]
MARGSLKLKTAWLDIPLADYEAHMALPSVGQAQLIARSLGELIRENRPQSAAIIGCAGGNGFEHLVGSTVRRAVGIDINSQYLERARERYAGIIPGLELYAADIQSRDTIFDPVDFIYAALVLEYVDPQAALPTLRRHCKTTGVFATLTQLPHRSLGHVSGSPYTSLKRLEPLMQLVQPDELVREAASAGFALEGVRTLATAAGKEFALHLFRVESDHVI